MTGSTAAVLASRTRQRREARIRENYERIFASLINPDSAKFAARYPTRVIPDVPGIFGLSKTEIKKDTKEIDKLSSFAHYPDFQDEESMQKRVMTSYRPAVPADSLLIKKQQRLIQWSKSEGLAHQHILQLKARVTDSKEKLSQAETSHSELEDSAELSRKYLLQMFNLLSTQSQILREQIKAVSERMMQDCQLSKPNQSNPLAIDWSATVSEYYSRFLQYCQLQRELSAVVQQHLSSPAGTKVPIASQVQVPLEELQSLSSFSPSFVADNISHIKKEDAEVSKSSTDADLMAGNGVEKEQEDLAKLFEEMQANMTRDEDLLEDLDVFFQDFLSTANSNSVATDDQSSSVPQYLVESVLLSNDELHKSGKIEDKIKIKVEPENVNSKEETVNSGQKDTAISSFNALMQGNRGDSQRLLNRHFQLLLSSLDPSPAPPSQSGLSNSNQSDLAGSLLMTRKKRTPAPSKASNEPIQGRATVRSRVERGIPLLFSPLSQYEDSYFGAVPVVTAYESRPTDSDKYSQGKHFIVHDFLPPEVHDLENDLLESLKIQSAIAMSAFHQKRLLSKQEELEKLIQEAEGSLAKSEHYYKQVLIEDYHERNRMKQALVAFGLLPKHLLSNSSTSMIGEDVNGNAEVDVFEGMDGLEALSQMISASAASDPVNEGNGGTDNEKASSSKRGANQRGKVGSTASEQNNEDNLSQADPSATVSNRRLPAKRKQAAMSQGPTGQLLSQASETSVNDQTSNSNNLSSTTSSKRRKGEK